MGPIPFRSSDIVRRRPKGTQRAKSHGPRQITDRLEIDRFPLTTQCEICESISTYLWPPCDPSKLASVVHMPFFFASTCTTHIEFIREVLGDQAFGPANPNLPWSINWCEMGGGFLSCVWTNCINGNHSRQLKFAYHKDHMEHYGTDDIINDDTDRIGASDGIDDGTNDDTDNIGTGDDIDDGTNDDTDYASTGDDTNALWIDPRLLSYWKENCEKRCACSKDQFHLNLPRSNPSWFIDTKQHCLVPACPNMSYVALSYVWGNAKQYLTTKAAIEQLGQPGALCEDALGITQVIKDAIRITPCLNERYLWVDTLCIVQDDETTKLAAIDNMCSIYANSAVTIIAADGLDANYGLRGIRRASLRPRSIVLRTFPLTPDRTVITGRSFFNYNSPTSWHRRAWTFQEAIFSRRLLIFYRDSLHWECIRSQPKHDSLGLGNLANSKTGLNEYIAGNLPDLSQFARLIYEYTQRRLSYPEDALRAFAGMATALRSTQFPGGFRSGLPVDFFHVALLWYSCGTLTRRVQSKIKDDCPLPSWSWAGWSGLLDLSCWHMAMEYIEPFRGYGMFAIDTSLVQWKTHQSLGDEGIPVKSIDFEAMAEYTSTVTSSLPADWEKIDALDNRNGSQRVDAIVQSGAPSDELLPSCRYQYKGRGLFRYPVVGSEDNTASTNLYASFLSCRCNRARMLLALTEPVVNTIQASNALNLTNFHHVYEKSGAWAGILQILELPGTIIDSQIYGSIMAEIELVAISSAWAYENDNTEHDPEIGLFILPEYFCSKRKRRGWRYEFYNVFWIEWDSGVAYRRGLGRVDKEIWESLGHDNINLVLG